MGNGKSRRLRRHAPSFNGAPSTANPEGIFPGSAAAGTAIPPSASDSVLTSGLRNSRQCARAGEPHRHPYRPAIPRRDARLAAARRRRPLNESSVTTLSGRQTEIQVVDLMTIVTGTSLNQTTLAAAAAPPSAVSAGGGGAVGSTVNYPTTLCHRSDTGRHSLRLGGWFHHPDDHHPDHHRVPRLR